MKSNTLKSKIVLKSKKRIPDQPKQETRRLRDSFPIVGIGASAGGLEAFLQVFSTMPTDTGLGFVLVQHLDRTHPSMSVDIIARSTNLKVEEVKDGTRIEPNHIYVIPPNFNMTINERVLSLSTRDVSPGQNMTINVFLQSLAISEKSRAIGIVLSGTGSDGTSGLMAIKVEGGITYAQDPKTAKYPGMPQSAITAGAVDLILRPESIAAELSRLVAHPYIAAEEFEISNQFDEGEDSNSALSEENSEVAPNDQALEKLFALLRSQKKVDFSGYKKTTIMRRIQRRMVVQKRQDLLEYVKFLETHEEEIQALYDDILINVTDFFRDPESFEALTKEVLPNLLKNKPKGSTIRIWVPGCSTGEEVYSIAIALLEVLETRAQRNAVQIFATDISEYAIQKARTGQYSDSVGGLSQPRLSRFFQKIDGGYQIIKAVRDLCLFSRHDVTSDPPFAKLDLISCRNVMIYFGKDLQKRVIPIFHYALLPSGFLWLGRAESLGDFSQLFSLVDKVHKIYSRSSVPTPMIRFSSKQAQAIPDVSKTLRHATKNDSEFQRDADKILLSKYAPAGVIVNSDLEILQFRGRTVPFLEPATGQPSLNLIKMVRPELLASLRTTIQSVKKANKAMVRSGLHFESDGRHISCDLEIIPIDPKALVKDRRYLVLFKEPKTGEFSSKDDSKRGKKGAKTKARLKEDKRTSELLAELLEIKDFQQALVEQYESTEEELTSANEELQSTNEELQSTNEEIETAQEELQSTNEELITVNEELQMRNADLTTLSSDLNNVLASIEIPVLIVGSDFRVRRFSPRAKSAFNLIFSDVGRPIGDIKPSFDLNLSQVIAEVIESLSPKQLEVQSFKGSWLRLQVRPYKTVDNKIDGAIITLTDIDEIKKREERTMKAYIKADEANLAKDVFLATLSHELRTPLSSILTWAQLIAQGKVNYEQAKRGAAVIEQNAKTQNQLIDDLLDISRIIVGKLAIEIKEVDPGAVIRTATESVRPLAEKKSIKIKLDIPNSAELIRVDPTRLQQIVWNLLNNAIKFSPNGSTISIELTYLDVHNGRIARLRISDQGKGVPAEFLPYIFKRFMQADGSSTREHGGLGLGLSIVSSLVEMQSGTVKAENNPGGKGAIFTVTFPVISHQTAITTNDLTNDLTNGTPGNKDKSIRQTPKLDGLRILIVDDDQGTREAISIYLKSFGAEVTSVSSAAEALDVFSSFDPSIILSDLAMPGEDGYSLIRKIRALDDGKGGKVPALSLSAYTSDADAKDALLAGFQAHVTKPVEATELARLILKTVVERNQGPPPGF